MIWKDEICIDEKVSGPIASSFVFSVHPCKAAAQQTQEEEPKSCRQDVMQKPQMHCRGNGKVSGMEAECLTNADGVLKEAWDCIKPKPELTHSDFKPVQTE